MPLLRAALLAVIAAGAAAQTAPRSAEPDARFAPLDAPLPGGRPAILSPAPAGSPPQAAPAGIDVSMILREIVIRPGGAALAATPGIGAAMDAFRGREVGLAELERLRRRMTEALVSAGYVSSGALLREIDLDAGAAVFELVEGRLTGVAVAGDGVADGPRAPLEITADYVRGRLAFPAGPFNLNEAEERLRILLRDRAIARVDAEIRPGAAPGDTALAIEATRARPYDLSVAFANDTPDGIGEETARLNAALRNVLTSGDELRAEAELSEGRRRAIVEGDAPLHPGGPAPFFTAEYSTSAFVTRPLGDLDVENSLLRFGGGLRLPLIETSRRSLTAVAGFDWKRARSELLGRGFSFSDGVENGVSRTAVASLAAEFVDLDDDRTLALRAALNVGLPVLGASDAATGPDGEFVTLVAQAQLAQRLSPGIVLIARAQGQLADGRLLPLEQVAIGGRDTVRGYGEAVVSGDHALVGSLEAQFTVADLAAPGLTPPGSAAPLILAPFIDAGAVWRQGGGGDTLVGVGAGLLWSPRQGIDASLYVGGALTSRRGGGGLQGEGVHLAIAIALP